MLIKELELSNYRQHETLTASFDGNLIGVLGPNGSGKSHLMDAMEFSFAGRVGGQNKGDMLRWGADEGFVRLRFEHLGVEGEIYRELHSTKASFTYGEDKITGISKVNKAIAEKTGLDVDICKQAVFVHQKEVDAVLFTEPSVRQLAWQRLCGLGASSVTHEKLGKFISDLPEIDDFTERIGEALERIAEATKELTEAQENLQLTGESVDNIDELAELTRKVELLRGVINTGVEGSQALAAERQQMQEASIAIGAVDVELNAYLDNPEAALQPATEMMNNAVTSLAASQRRDGYKAQYDTLSASLATLALPYTQAQLTTCTEQLAHTVATLTTAAANNAMAAKLVQAISGSTADGNCPLCGQPVSDDIEKIARDTQAVTANSHKAAQVAVAAAQQQAQLVEAAINKHTTDQATLQTSLASVEAQLKEIEQQITVTVDAAGLAQLREQVETLKQRVEVKRRLESKKVGFQSQLLILERTVQQRAEQVEVTLAQAQTLMSETGVNSPGAIQNRFEELTGKMTRAREVREQVASLTGQIKEMEKSLSNLNTTVTKLRDREAKQAALKSVLDTLATVRKWFHYQEGPQTVINSLLERITSGVNDFLDKFGAGFYAIPDFGTTSFRYWYTDGRTAPEDGFPPVDEMSGGEAVVLAVSFRFATYCLFASRIGLLTLDEPTVYLDDNNIGRFCKLLTRVKELATNMNLQVFISTHERAVLPFMDSNIRFGAYKEEEELSVS